MGSANGQNADTADSHSPRPLPIPLGGQLGRSRSPETHVLTGASLLLICYGLKPESTKRLEDTGRAGMAGGVPEVHHGGKGAIRRIDTRRRQDGEAERACT